MKKILKYVLGGIALLLVIAIIVFIIIRQPKVDPNIDKDKWNTNYTYVFVHGLSGWGSYDMTNKFVPYWGMFGGSTIKYLNKQGFDCYAASVDPHGSAWDRACELYAQLTGTVVDYGAAHSKEYKHDRYGKDFTGKALIDTWSAEDKINLVGHSFGGATVRLFSELMANGDANEQAATAKTEISEFFTGGKADWIYSITTLAAPHNGTTAYNVGDVEDPAPPSGFSATIENMLGNAMSKANSEDGDGRDTRDYAAYDMYIDNALTLNERINTLGNIYYFSVPCSSTEKTEKGNYLPKVDITDIMFRRSARLMGTYTGKTDGGYIIDKNWLENDGLVNTISATAPFNSPTKKFDAESITPGVWNIMPTYEGDHMSIQGGLFKVNHVKDYYVDFMTVINEIEK